MRFPARTDNVLFNSYPFLFVFLPIALAGFFALGKTPRFAAGWLVLCSLYFYGFWNPVYVALLIVSITFNFILGGHLSRRTAGARPSRAALTFAVCANVALLGYYKYANFFVDNVN